MAFAQIQAADTGVSNETSNTTSHGGVVPANLVSGNLMLAMVAIDRDRGINVPSGWTSIQNIGSSSAVGTATWYRIAGASESNFTWTSDEGDTSLTRILRITGWHGTTAPEAADAVGNSANPDPPSLNPANWGTEDTLWVAWYAIDGSIGEATAYPTNFDDNQVTGDSGAAGGPSFAYCSRENAAASQDPGTFTCATEQWAAITIAIRPVAAGGPAGPPVGSLATMGFGL